MSESDGNSLSYLAGVAVALMAQIVAGIVWITSLGGRVKTLELEREADLAEWKRHEAELQAEISKIDYEGTRALGIIAAIQKDVLRRLALLENDRGR